MVEFAITEKKKELHNILLYHKALHRYVETMQKPVIYRLKNEQKLYQEFFDPKLLSFTYITRNLQAFANEIRKENNDSNYYYKLASNNPRNLINQANAMERKLLQEFNREQIKHSEKIITENSKQFLYYGVPIGKNKASCMRCHGDPKDAPTEMLKLYGDKHGFYEKLGDIRAMISLKMPLAKELEEAQSYYSKIIFLVLVSFLILYGTIGYFLFMLSKKDKIITQKNEELEILATHDSLTHIYNRLMFDKHLQMLIDAQSKFILALFDIDHFKAINDQYGHDIGDEILIELTRLIQETLRKEDRLFRVGGEEFAIIFESMGIESATQIVQRIRQEVEAYTFSNDIKLTISFGIDAYQSNATATQIYKHTDIALYQAKKSGRNQVVTYKSSVMDA